MPKGLFGGRAGCGAGCGCVQAHTHSQARAHVCARAHSRAVGFSEQASERQWVQSEGTQQAGAFPNRPSWACLEDRGGSRRQRQRGWRSSQIQQRKRIGVRRACRGGGRPVEAKEIKQRLHLLSAGMATVPHATCRRRMACANRASATFGAAVFASSGPPRLLMSTTGAAAHANVHMRPKRSRSCRAVCVRVSVRACAYTPRTNARTHAHARTHTHTHTRVKRLSSHSPGRGLALRDHKSPSPRGP